MNGVFELEYLKVFSGACNGSANDRDYEEPVDGREEVPSNGLFGAEDAAADGSSRAGFVGVEEPSLERYPRHWLELLRRREMEAAPLHEARR